jgi:hypothetical protein
MELLFKKIDNHSLKFIDRVEKSDKRIKNARRIIGLDCFDNPMIYYVEESEE